MADGFSKASDEECKLWPRIISAYHEHLKEPGTKSENTIKSYVRCLARLVSQDAFSPDSMATDEYAVRVKDSPDNKRGGGQLSACIKGFGTFWREAKRHPLPELPTSSKDAKMYQVQLVASLPEANAEPTAATPGASAQSGTEALGSSKDGKAKKDKADKKDPNSKKDKKSEEELEQAALFAELGLDDDDKDAGDAKGDKSSKKDKKRKSEGGQEGKKEKKLKKEDSNQIDSPKKEKKAQKEGKNEKEKSIGAQPAEAHDAEKTAEKPSNEDKKDLGKSEPMQTQNDVDREVEEQKKTETKDVDREVEEPKETETKEENSQQDKQAERNIGQGEKAAGDEQGSPNKDEKTTTVGEEKKGKKDKKDKKDKKEKKRKKDGEGKKANKLNDSDDDDPFAEISGAMAFGDDGPGDDDIFGDAPADDLMLPSAEIADAKTDQGTTSPERLPGSPRRAATTPPDAERLPGSPPRAATTPPEALRRAPLSAPGTPPEALAAVAVEGEVGGDARNTSDDGASLAPVAEGSDAGGDAKEEEFFLGWGPTGFLQEERKEGVGKRKTVFERLSGAKMTVPSSNEKVVNCEAGNASAMERARWLLHALENMTMGGSKQLQFPPSAETGKGTPTRPKDLVATVIDVPAELKADLEKDRIAQLGDSCDVIAAFATKEKPPEAEISMGDLVEAKYGNGFFDAQVLEVTKSSVKVIYIYDGSEADVPRGDVKVIAVPKVGDAVEAKYGNSFFDAEVVGTSEGKVKVKYKYDGSEAELPKEDVREVAAKPGSNQQGGLEKLYVFGEIRNRRLFVLRCFDKIAQDKLKLHLDEIQVDAVRLLDRPDDPAETFGLSAMRLSKPGQCMGTKGKNKKLTILITGAELAFFPDDKYALVAGSGQQRSNCVALVRAVEAGATFKEKDVKQLPKVLDPLCARVQTLAESQELFMRNKAAVLNEIEAEFNIFLFLETPPKPALKASVDMVVEGSYNGRWHKATVVSIPPGTGESKSTARIRWDFDKSEADVALTELRVPGEDGDGEKQRLTLAFVGHEHAREAAKIKCMALVEDAHPGTYVEKNGEVLIRVGLDAEEMSKKVQEEVSKLKGGDKPWQDKKWEEKSTWDDKDKWGNDKSSESHGSTWRKDDRDWEKNNDKRKTGDDDWKDWKKDGKDSWDSEQSWSGDDETKAKVQKWIEAKRKKDFTTADALRKELRAGGVDPEKQYPKRQAGTDDKQEWKGSSSSWDADSKRGHDKTQEWDKSSSSWDASAKEERPWKRQENQAATAWDDRSWDRGGEKRQRSDDSGGWNDSEKKQRNDKQSGSSWSEAAWNANEQTQKSDQAPQAAAQPAPQEVVQSMPPAQAVAPALVAQAVADPGAEIQNLQQQGAQLLTMQDWQEYQHIIWRGHPVLPYGWIRVWSRSKGSTYFTRLQDGHSVFDSEAILSAPPVAQG